MRVLKGILALGSSCWLAVGSLWAADAVHGTELLRPGATITLTNTPAAPLSARASAGLTATSSGPATGFVLIVDTQGLRPGSYRVEAVRKTGGTALFLGSMVLRDPALAPEKEAGDSRHEDSTTQQSEVLRSHTEFEWPPDFPPAEAARVRITDVGGTVLLVSPPAVELR